VTITISGSSSTGTSTETSTETATATGGAAGKGGKGGSKGKPTGKGAGVAPDTGDKRPHVYHITVNSTGQSGHAVDGAPKSGGVKGAKKSVLKGLVKKAVPAK
jgi:hypothetical protein